MTSYILIIMWYEIFFYMSICTTMSPHIFLLKKVDKALLSNEEIIPQRFLNKY